MTTSRDSAEPGAARAFLEQRRARLLASVERPLRRVGEGGEALPAERLEFLLLEAQDLYWNELSWEEVTDEERVAGGHLTELVFPGLLAFVDGLLLEPDAGSPAGAAGRPRPEVVEAILHFLSARHAELLRQLGSGVDSERVVWARAMTARLVDLVLCRLYGLGAEELEWLEAGS